MAGREDGDGAAQQVAQLEYVSVGCNRCVHAADWSHRSHGLVAYGAAGTVAVYDVHAARVLHTIPGHEGAHVNAVRWLTGGVEGDASGHDASW